MSDRSHIDTNGAGTTHAARAGRSLLPSELDFVSAGATAGGPSRPAGFPGAFPSPGGPEAELSALLRSIHVLAATCSEALEKAAQHFHGEDPWLIGALPVCTQLADGVEAQARGYIAHSHLTSSDIADITDLLKASGDLRAAARGGRQAAQLVPLLRQEGGGDSALEPIRPLADAAVDVAVASVEALRNQDIPQARSAALLYRAVDDCRFSLEREWRGEAFALRYSPTALRLLRGAAWNFAVAGESMARVAVRLVLTEK
jgi:hypothetical protein